jgi:hypothetical protein
MSVLSFPRLYLGGGHMSWDPVVSNNTETDYDVATGEALLRPGESVADFRARLMRDPRDWNFYGTHVCATEGVTVTGGVTGPRSSPVDDDELLAAPVGLSGKLVDIDPAGILSQVFFDEFSLGLPGRAQLRARPLRRMSSRWINFNRNSADDLQIAGGAAAAWQAVFPAAGVEFVRAQESPLLSRFAEALGDPRALGLMLRLCTYRTVYYQNGGASNPFEPAATQQELIQKYTQGKIFSNPAYSLLVASVGIWLDGDSEAVPGGRILLPTTGSPLGPAAAELDAAAGLLSLDFSHTFPETDRVAHKADLGPVRIEVVDAVGTQTIAELPFTSYDREAYRASAGIVDVDLTGQPDLVTRIAEGRLSLHAEAVGPALAEADLTAWCEDANVYTDEGDDGTLTIQVRDRGRIPPAAVSVLVATYDQSEQVVAQTQLPVSAAGTAELHVPAVAPGVRHLRFLPFAGEQAPQVAAGIPYGTAQLTSVRTLPSDDALEAGTRDEHLIWEFVYRRILRTYDAVTPRMSTIIDLADRDAVRTFARRILEVVDDGLFESARYMPVTRDLSRGKRRLLRRFCELALLGEFRAPAGPPPVRRPEADAAPVAVPEPRPRPLDKRAPR